MYHISITVLYIFIECIMYTFKFKHFSYLRICNNSDFRCYMVFLNTMKFRKKMWHFIFIRHRKYAKYHYSHLHIWTKSIISKYILRVKYNTFKHLDLLCCELLSHVWLFVTPWTVAHQTPLSMGMLQARILEWVAMPSSRRSSQPRDRTQVSCIAGGFFTVWATREAQRYWSE